MKSALVAIFALCILGCAAQRPRDGQWKVRKSTMRFRVEWPVDTQRRAFMSKDADGNWQPVGSIK